MEAADNRVFFAVATGCRLRRRYRDLIRAEVTDTLADAADAEGEIKHLLAAMG